MLLGLQLVATGCIQLPHQLQPVLMKTGCTHTHNKNWYANKPPLICTFQLPTWNAQNKGVWTIISTHFMNHCVAHVKYPLDLYKTGGCMLVGHQPIALHQSFKRLVATSCQPVFDFCSSGCNCNWTDHGLPRTGNCSPVATGTGPVWLPVFWLVCNWTLKH